VPLMEVSKAIALAVIELQLPTTDAPLVLCTHPQFCRVMHTQPSQQALTIDFSQTRGSVVVDPDSASVEQDP